MSTEIENFAIPPALPAITFDRSADVGDLMIALAKAQGEYESATKDSNNPYYNSKYADLATIIAAVRPSLSKNGIAFIHTVTADLERQTAGATAYLFHGNQYISASCELPAVGKSKDGKDRFDAQTIGAAQTYARRYSGAPLLGIAQEDDDGNSIVRDDSRKVERKVAPNQASSETQEWAEAAAECLTLEAGNALVNLARERASAIGLGIAKRVVMNHAKTLDKFNEHVVPLMKDGERNFIVAAAEEAKRRHYGANRDSGLYTEGKRQ